MSSSSKECRVSFPSSAQPPLSSQTGQVIKHVLWTGPPYIKPAARHRSRTIRRLYASTSHTLKVRDNHTFDSRPAVSTDYKVMQIFQEQSDKIQLSPQTFWQGWRHRWPDSVSLKCAASATKRNSWVIHCILCSRTFWSLIFFNLVEVIIENAIYGYDNCSDVWISEQVVCTAVWIKHLCLYKVTAAWQS